MSVYHGKAINKDEVRIIDESNGEVFDDFNPPLTSEKIEVLNFVISDVENEIAILEFYTASDLSAEHELNQQRDVLLKLFQNNNEWHKAQTLH